MHIRATLLSPRALVIAALALCALSLLALHGPGRFQVQSPAPGLEAVSDLANWRASPYGVERLPGGARVSAEPSGRPSFLYLVFRRPGDGTLLRVSAEMRGLGLTDGLVAGGAGQLMAVSLEAGGRRVPHWPYRVGGVDHDEDWRSVQRVLPAPPGAPFVQLAVFVVTWRGAMEIRGLSVEQVVEHPAYVAGRWLLYGAWVGLGVLVLAALLRRGGRWPWRALFALAACVALTMALLPPPTVNAAVRTALIGGQDLVYDLAAAWQAPPPAATSAGAPSPPPLQTGEGEAGAGSSSGESPAAAERDEGGEAEVGATAAASDPRPAQSEQRVYWMPAGQNLDKRAHLAGFALLALLAAFAHRGVSPWRTVVPLLGLFALAIETLQGFTVMREPNPLDFAADLVGALLGATLAALVGGALRRLAARRGDAAAGA